MSGSAVTFRKVIHGIFVPKEKTYATLVPKNVNPVVTA